MRNDINIIRLYKVALYWRKKYEDVCPDIGMGTFDSTLLENLILQSGVNLTNTEKQQILQ